MQQIKMSDMKIVLIKMSAPGWEKEFDNEYDLRQELYSCICSMCRNGDEITDLVIEVNSPIDDMLCTPCGCEYHVEYEDEK
jgi:hypothetical protein